MLRTILIISFLTALVSCNQSDKELSEEERSAVVREARSTLNNYFVDIKKYGLTKEFEYLDHSDAFFWIPPGYLSAIPYDSVARILKATEGRYLSVENTFDTLTVIAVKRKIATYSARISSTMIDTSGHELHIKLLESGVMIKRDKDWKLLSGQTTLIE